MTKSRRFISHNSLPRQSRLYTSFKDSPSRKLLVQWFTLSYVSGVPQKSFLKAWSWWSLLSLKGKRPKYEISDILPLLQIKWNGWLMDKNWWVHLVIEYPRLPRVYGKTVYLILSKMSSLYPSALWYIIITGIIINDSRPNMKTRNLSNLKYAYTPGP